LAWRQATEPSTGRLGRPTAKSSDKKPKNEPSVNDFTMNTQSDERLTVDATSRVSPEPRVRSQVPGLLVHFVVVLFLTSSTAFTFAGPRAAASAALGVVLAALNLLLMRKVMGALTAASGGSAAWALALPLKLVALVGAAFALVQLRVAQPVPLAIGFALLPLTGVFLPRASSVPAPSSPRARPTRARN
jgi:hypothetical protein